MVEVCRRTSNVEVLASSVYRLVEHPLVDPSRDECPEQIAIDQPAMRFCLEDGERTIWRHGFLVGSVSCGQRIIRCPQWS